MKGQVSIVQHNIIPRVVLMLRDPMPNAASAAGYALYKISTLYIGVAALVHAKVPRILLQTICSTDDNLVLKISSAETLIQIHKLDPSCPIVGRDDIKALQKSAVDKQFKALLCQLLDLWGEERIPIKPSDATQMALMARQRPNQAKPNQTKPNQTIMHHIINNKPSQQMTNYRIQ